MPVQNAKPQSDNYDAAKRSRAHREEAPDDTLKNTFPASDPVSIEQLIPPTPIREQGTLLLVSAAKARRPSNFASWILGGEAWLALGKLRGRGVANRVWA